MISDTKMSNKYQIIQRKTLSSLSFVRQDKWLHYENDAKNIAIKIVHQRNKAGGFYEGKIQQMRIT